MTAIVRLGENLPRGEELDEASARVRGRDVRGPGLVSLVGAGPGDPELITRKGARRLAEADLVHLAFFWLSRSAVHAFDRGYLIRLRSRRQNQNKNDNYWIPWNHN